MVLRGVMVVALTLFYFAENSSAVAQELLGVIVSHTKKPFVCVEIHSKIDGATLNAKGSIRLHETKLNSLRRAPNKNKKRIRMLEKEQRQCIKKAKRKEFSTLGLNHDMNSCVSSDLNSNGVVDFLDLSLFLSHYGKNNNTVYDLNRDGVVDLGDLALLLSCFHNYRGASSTSSSSIASTGQSSSISSISVASSSQSSASAPSVQPFTIEAEAMTLSEYRIEPNSAGSGQRVISMNGPVNPTGSARSVLGDIISGNYQIVVSYFDENDGQSQMSVLVNGTVVSSWVNDMDLGSGDAIAQTLTQRTVAQSITLHPGDSIELRGTRNGTEYARFDKAAFLSPQSSQSSSLSSQSNSSSATSQSIPSSASSSSSRSSSSNAINQPPAADPQAVYVAQNSATAITLTGTDAERDPLIFAISNSPLHGTFTGTPPNLIYNPDQGYLGPDSFTFTVRDASHNTPSAPAIVSLSIISGPTISGRLTMIPTQGFRPKMGQVNLALIGSNGSPDFSIATDVDGNFITQVPSGWTGQIVAENPNSLILYPRNLNIDTPVTTPQVARNFSAWHPPIGIPSPTFGITEQAPPAPSPWTGPVPGFYYVDYYAAGSVDNNNPYGYPGHARLTIPDNLPAGAVVEVHGNYRYYSDVQFINSSGTVQSPVFIRGQSATQMPFVTSRLKIRGSYTILEYLEFGDRDGDLNDGLSGKVSFLTESNHLVLRYSDLHGNLMEGGMTVGGTDQVVWNNQIHDVGNWSNTVGDQDVHALSTEDGVLNLWVLDNNLYHSSGDGLQVSGSTVESIGQVYFGRNHSHHHKQSGFGCKKAHDIIVSQNQMHSFTRSDSSPGLVSGYQYGQRNLWYLFNDLYDAELGIQDAASNGENQHGRYFVGNLIHNIHAVSIDNVNNPYHSGQAWAMWGWGNKFFVNNTIYATDGGMGWDGDQTLHIANNIFANMLPGTHQINIESGIAGNASEMLYNLIQGQVSIRWNSPGQSHTYTTLAAFQAATGKGQASINGNAGFIDPSAADFHLAPTSQAINAGTVDPVYQTFMDLYGLNIAYDFDGKRRPVDGQWDMGAFEAN